MGFRRRLLLLYLTGVLGMLAVWLRVVQLQVLGADHWQEAARRLRERTVDLEPRRGAIVDGEGRLLVEDAPVLQLALVPAEWKSRERLRCSACGALWFFGTGEGATPRPRRCRCKAPSSSLVPQGRGDVEPLERLLGLRPGTLAEQAAARQEGIDRLVAAYEARLLADEDEEEFLHDQKVEIYRQRKEELPFPVVSDVTQEVARLVGLDEHGEFRGLLLRPAHRRRASETGGPLARVLGQSSMAASAEELARLRRENPGADIDARTQVGVAGLERRYDSVLRGRGGTQRLARDDQGSFTREVETQPAESGRRLRLALRVRDCAGAQRCLEALPHLGDNYAPGTQPSGALVALNARTGEILALAELPVFDPEEALRRADAGYARIPAKADVASGTWVPARRVPGPPLEGEDRERVLAATQGFERLLLPWLLAPPVLVPLDDLPADFDLEAWRRGLSEPVSAGLSRVSQVAVEPGSTFKPFIGLAMLGSGLPLPMDGFECAAHHEKPKCHVHGAVGFEDALRSSCNRFFAYSLRNFASHWPTYRTQVAAFIDRLGFGHPTGSDIEGEARGRWLRAQEWQPGDTPAIPPDDGQNVAIGQGPVLVTPLQMVRAVAVLANGGRLITPHLARSFEDASGGDELVAPPSMDLGVAPEHLARVRDGLHRVIYEVGGTARKSYAWDTLPGTVYGKTGTAQAFGRWRPFDAGEDTEITHQWFVGWFEQAGRDPLAFAIVYHARREGVAGSTAASTAGAFLAWWASSR